MAIYLRDLVLLHLAVFPATSLSFQFLGGVCTIYLDGMGRQKLETETKDKSDERETKIEEMVQQWVSHSNPPSGLGTQRR